MKIAISGKGGVGKTTFAAMLGRTLVKMGYRVLAIDADPDANLAQTLGIPNYQNIVALSEMKNLILERTEARNNGEGTLYKLNPIVSDLVEKLSIEHEGIRLIIMGTVKKGGSGCICPASTMLKALMSHLVLQSKEVLVLDMEAGLEHLGRGTSRGVDALIIIVEPGQRSVNTAIHIRKLANDLGLFRVFVVGNKIRSKEDKEFLEKTINDFTCLGFIDYEKKIIDADIKGICPTYIAEQSINTINLIAQRLLTKYN